MKQYEEWIKQHLPKDIPADILSNTFCYRGFYISGLDVYTEGDRGPDKIQHLPYTSRSPVFFGRCYHATLDCLLKSEYRLAPIRVLSFGS